MIFFAPTAFFRIPPCLIGGAAPTPVQKRTGEFATETDVHSAQLLDQIEHMMTDQPIIPTLQHDLTKVMQRSRAELAARRERDFFRLVEPHAREGGSGYVASCMLEDWLRAVVIATKSRRIWDIPVMRLRTMTDWLRLTESRIDQCYNALAQFTEVQVTTAAMACADHINRNDPGGLANLMIRNMEQATMITPDLLRTLQIPPGTWRKTLRDGIADRVHKVIGITMAAVEHHPDNDTPALHRVPR